MYFSGSQNFTVPLHHCCEVTVITPGVWVSLQTHQIKIQQGTQALRKPAHKAQSFMSPSLCPRDVELS